MIGYWLLQAHAERAARPAGRRDHQPDAGRGRTTRPSTNPTKFVGEVYAEAGASGWRPSAAGRSSPDGDGWRRVVGSPRPQRVVETRLIRLLLDSGAVVVCAGGGGVPVIRDERGQLRGVEAVVDKDLTSAVLAEALDADVLLVLTDVPHVVRGFGTPEARADPARDARRRCARATSRPGRWARRSTPYAGSSSSPATWPPSAGSRTPRRSLRGQAGTIVTPDGEYRSPPDMRPSARATAQF